MDPGEAGDHMDEVFKILTSASGLNAKTPLVLMGSPSDAPIPTEVVPMISAVLAKPFTIDEIIAVLRALPNLKS